MKLSGPIILIDDDEDDHDFIQLICKKIGVQEYLRHFTGGLEFLSYLRTTNEAPFIILCDINMPVMNGLQLRLEINSDEKLRLKSIPFIFFSTSANVKQVMDAYELTVQGFFTKGISFEETYHKIRRILEYWSDCKHPNNP